MLLWIDFSFKLVFNVILKILPNYIFNLRSGFYMNFVP